MQPIRHWNNHPFRHTLILDYLNTLFIQPQFDLVTVVDLHNGFIRFCHCLINDYKIFPIQHLTKLANHIFIPDF